MQLWQQVIVGAGIILANVLVGWSIYRMGRDAGRRQVTVRTLGPANIELGTRIRLVEAGSDDATAFRLKALQWNEHGGFELVLEDEKRRRPTTW